MLYVNKINKNRLVCVTKEDRQTDGQTEILGYFDSPLYSDLEYIWDELNWVLDDS